MIFENRNNLFIGRFSKLFNHPHIVHGFSTRVGGVSQVPYDTLNLGHHTTDRKPYIKKNQNRFFQSLQIPTTQLAVPQQVHSAHILKSIPRVIMMKPMDC